jgi:hypothetical protein
MKWFERLVMTHIITNIPDTLDPHSTPTDPQMTQSHSTLPFLTWTKGTLM